jgi:hypothetical protein
MAKFQPVSIPSTGPSSTHLVSNKNHAMSFPIDRPNLSPVFVEVWTIAGVALQAQFRQEAGKVEPQVDYRWIKAELTWPSFDHLTFGYGNQIFSVLVDVTHDGQFGLTEQQIDRCLKACTENNLIPCIFRVNPDPIRPASAGWNLEHLVTSQPIVPKEWANSERVELSEWELRNFSIQIILNHIDEIGGEVLSFCDVPGVDPQIWFSDKAGNRSWVIVRHFPKLSDDQASTWFGFEKSNPQLLDYDGYFAALSIASGEPILLDRDGSVIPLSERFTGLAPLYRGSMFDINFDKLQRIFVS